MGRFKLSFVRGKTIAFAIDRNNKIVHTIKVMDNNEDSKPDIEVDDIISILTNDDMDNIARILKLSRIEKKVLKKALINKNKTKLNNKLKDAFDLTLELLNDKLKGELEFDNDIKVIPALGHKDTPFDRHIFIAGASNSGKSFFAGELLRFDLRKRPITLISKLFNDPAFEHLKEESSSEDENSDNIEVEDEDKSKKKKKKKKKNPDKRLKHFAIRDEADILNLPSKESLKTDIGHIILFDDIDTFSPDVSEYLRRYQNDLLETARKSNISIISTSHGLKRYQKTRTNLNEAEWIVLFPSSNQMLSTRFLRDSLGLLKHERDRIIQKAARNHYMAIKTSSPILVIHERGIILL